MSKTQLRYPLNKFDLMDRQGGQSSSIRFNHKQRNLSKGRKQNSLHYTSILAVPREQNPSVFVKSLVRNKDRNKLCKSQQVTSTEILNMEKRYHNKMAHPPFDQKSLENISEA